MQREVDIGPKRQLVDLNGDTVNFDLTVNLIAKDSSAQFQGVIVTQSELDSGAELEYRDFEGSLRARLTNDKGVYENHFLCVRSDKQVPAMLEIDLNEVEVMPRISKEFDDEVSDDESDDQSTISALRRRIDAKQAGILTDPSQGSLVSSIRSYATAKNVTILTTVVAIMIGVYLIWSRGGVSFNKGASSLPIPDGIASVPEELVASIGHIAPSLAAVLQPASAPLPAAPVPAAPIPAAPIPAAPIPTAHVPTVNVNIGGPVPSVITSVPLPIQQRAMLAPTALTSLVSDAVSTVSDGAKAVKKVVGSPDYAGILDNLKGMIDTE